MGVRSPTLRCSDVSRLMLAALGLVAALVIACNNGDGSSDTVTPGAGETPVEASPTLAITPPSGPLSCAGESTDRFEALAADVSYVIYCPRTIPEGFGLSALDKLFTPGELGPDDPNRNFIRTIYRKENGDQITILQGILGEEFAGTILSIYPGQTAIEIAFGDRAADFYEGHGADTGIPISGSVLASSQDIGVMYFMSGDLDDETMRAVAAAMRAVEL